MMQKIIIITLILALLLGLSGCNKFNQSTETTQQTTSSIQDTTPIVTDTPKQLPMLAVSLAKESQSKTADDGTKIYQHTYQNINLVVTDPEVADKIIVEFLNRTDLQSTVSSVHTSALQAYSQNNAGFIPYWTQILYEPMRIDSSILSLSGRYTQYSGSAHPMHTYEAVTYDLISGNVLKLNDILTIDVNKTTLCNLILQSLDKQKSSLYIGYETTIKELLNKPLEDINNWCLDNTGLCFSFSPYEIGPYSSDFIYAQIPYSDLSGILRDEYFPAERNTTPGSLNADIFNEKTLDRFTQFAEVVITKDADKIVLHTDSIVYDVRLQTGSLSADGTTFVAESTVFAAYTLTPGDGLMIQAAFNDTLPNLRLTYTTAGKTVEKFISINNDAVTFK